MTHTTLRVLRTGLLALALLPLAHTASAQGRPLESIVGTWDVSIEYRGYLLHQKWVLAADGSALLTCSAPYVPLFGSGTWRRNSEYFVLADNAGGPEECFRCTVAGNTFSLVPVDWNGRRNRSEHYIGERR